MPNDEQIKDSKELLYQTREHSIGNLKALNQIFHQIQRIPIMSTNAATLVLKQLRDSTSENLSATFSKETGAVVRDMWQSPQ